MADEKVEDPLADYDGPWVKKRIEFEYEARHSIEVYGSWNGFKGGDELNYEGRETYAIELELPLGNYVYRFRVDDEDWETDNRRSKNIRDGNEYNTINVKSGDSESDEEEEGSDEENPPEADEDGQGKLVYDEETGGFVVNKGQKKKRRGRPSLEIELPNAFVEDAQKQEAADAEEEAQEDKGKKKKKEEAEETENAWLRST